MITNVKGRRRRVQKLLMRYNGGTATTTTIDRMQPAAAAEILAAGALSSGEEILAASWRVHGSWCLLTTEHLIWCEEGKVTCLPWHDVRGAQQPPRQAAQIVLEEITKDEISDLEVFDSQDQKYTLRVHAGSDYYIVWSGIIALANYTRGPDPAEIARHLPDGVHRS
jgi:hypothetical protein